jgi:hypothetical protein
MTRPPETSRGAAAFVVNRSDAASPVSFINRSHECAILPSPD